MSIFSFKISSVSLLKFLAKGIQNIAYLGSNMDQMVNRCRYQGYEEAYRKGKRKLNQDLVYTDLSSRAMVEKAVEELKNSGVECILCQDDYICDEVVRKLARMGVRIPDQMKVASCHYSRILENYPITITSLKFNITELGRRSCQVLLDMIHGQPGSLEHLDHPCSDLPGNQLSLRAGHFHSFELLRRNWCGKGREKEHPVFHEAYVNCDFCNVSDYRSLNR